MRLAWRSPIGPGRPPSSRLQRRLPAAEWIEASTVTAPLRAVKDDVELDALRPAGAAADRVAAAAAGRRDRARSAAPRPTVSAELADRSWSTRATSRSTSPSSAADPMPPVPITSPDRRVIGRGRDGGVRLRRELLARRRRRLLLGHHPDGRDRSAVRRGRASATRCCAAAQQAAVTSARAGVDGRARRPGGQGDHRRRRIRRALRPPDRSRDRHRGARGPLPGRGQPEALRPGHAFSVEPGIYWPGRFGMRLEDIVVIGEDGCPEPLNTADHDLVVVEA